jgi:hypothetical protein
MALKRSSVRFRLAPPTDSLKPGFQSLRISPKYPRHVRREGTISPTETDIFGLPRRDPPPVSRRKILFPCRVA